MAATMREKSQLAKGRFQKKGRNFPHFSGVGGFESHFPQKIF